MKKITFLCKVMIVIAFVVGFTSLTSAQNAWINEFHYDNSGTDAGEFIEVIIENVGSYTLSNFVITLYNGNGSAVYGTTDLSTFVLGGTSGTFSIYSKFIAGIQNGAPDGFSLSYSGTLIQFLSYEGSFTGAGGPANGVLSTNIGISQNGTEPAGSSLGLTGTGSNYSQFTWLASLGSNTKGSVNAGQTLSVTPDPEPTNYPTNFMAMTYGNSIMVNWTDATAGVGEQLPASYLLLISDQPIVTLPVDGTPVANDGDMSDGNGAVNVNYGVESGMFSMLLPETQYYFKIFPYTNGGSTIDFKTDGTPPTATATTQAIVNANNFEAGFGSWTPYNVASDRDWAVVNGGALGTAKAAQMNGYGEDIISNDWLISPQLNLNYYREAEITFYTWWRYGVEGELRLLYSKDYTGGDPSNATWTEVPFNIPATQQTWEFSGPVDLPDFNTGNVHLAFQYLSNGAPRWWKVDEIVITGTPADPIPLKTWSIIVAMVLMVGASLFIIRKRF